MSLWILGATPRSLGSDIKVQSCQNMTWLLMFNHTTAWGQSKNIFVHSIKESLNFGDIVAMCVGLILSFDSQILIMFLTLVLTDFDHVLIS